MPAAKKKPPAAAPSAAKKIPQGPPESIVVRELAVESSLEAAPKPEPAQPQAPRLSWARTDHTSVLFVDKVERGLVSVVRGNCWVGRIEGIGECSSRPTREKCEADLEARVLHRAW